ncbi:MAG: DUF1064 domain-containing protein, partial [Vicinamibacterales bacterium]
MSKGYRGWENFDPASRTVTPGAAPAKTRWTAKPCILTLDGTIYELAVAKKLKITGLRCGSLFEAQRMKELVLEQKAGLITALAFQPGFPLTYPVAGGLPIFLGTYVADFSYKRNGVLVVEDAKGKPGRTPIYQWKRQHFRA